MVAMHLWVKIAQAATATLSWCHKCRDDNYYTDQLMLRQDDYAMTITLVIVGQDITTRWPATFALASTLQDVSTTI